MNTRKLSVVLLLLVLGLGFYGCATSQPEKLPYKMTPQGTVIWEDEYEFNPPPKEWKLVQVESGGEFGFGFMRSEAGKFPSQSLFVYDEEPFGCSTKFEDREEEFFKRYLWAAPISMSIKVVEKKKMNVVGGEGLAVIAEGSDPIRKEKVRSKVVFGKRGDRVVSWYITQWRNIDGTFDPSSFEVFDKFVASFKFVKKSFYETL